MAHRTGLGQTVESSLTGRLISVLAYLSAGVLATGNNPERSGNNHPIVAPYGLFLASNGQIAVAPSNDTYVVRFLAAISLASLLLELRFADNASRIENRSELNALINARTRTNNVVHWIEAINQAGCSCGRVMQLDEMTNDPQVLSQQMIIASNRDGRAPIKMTGFPGKLSLTPCELRRPVPDLGEHTDEVLGLQPRGACQS